MAQNERTLFAFLGSGEPGSVLRVLDGDDAPATYRLDHLFDYLTDALGASLATGDSGRLWAETQSALFRLPDADALQVRLLKTIALLNFAGEPAGLKASPALLRVACDAPDAEVDAALEALVAARVAVFHASMGLYRVWQGSDFDVEARLAEARATLPAARPLADMLAEALPPTPAVARRHSYVTGTTRAFAVAYATEDSWRLAVRSFRADADREEEGLIVYVLPETTEPAALLDALPAALADEAGGETVLMAVPYGARPLREAVREWLALDHLATLHAETLQGDETARREVDARRRALDARVQDGFARLIEPDADGRIPCSWIGPDGPLGQMTGRSLQTHLSDAFDARYDRTPVVWNELVNRRRPSASATAGLKALLVAMIEHGAEARLGFEGTPAAVGLYVSIVEALGMHVRNEEPAPANARGTWRFSAPDAEQAGAHAAWMALLAQMQATGGAPVGVADLYATLAAPPFGLRSGLHALFLVAILRAHEREVALFYDGRFLPSFGIAEVEILLRVPEKFSVQWVALDRARAAIVAAVAPLVGVDAAGRDPLPVVVGLIRRARALPAFAQATTGLSDAAVAVREALRHAVEPASLLFRDLPAAVAASPDDAAAVAERVGAAMDELDGVYPGPPDPHRARRDDGPPRRRRLSGGAPRRPRGARRPAARAHDERRAARLSRPPSRRALGPRPVARVARGRPREAPAGDVGGRGRRDVRGRAARRGAAVSDARAARVQHGCWKLRRRRGRCRNEASRRRHAVSCARGRRSHQPRRCRRRGV